MEPLAYLDLLPHELRLKFMDELEPEAVSVYCGTYRSARDLCDERFYETKYGRDFGEIPKPDRFTYDQAYRRLAAYMPLYREVRSLLIMDLSLGELLSQSTGWVEIYPTRSLPLSLALVNIKPDENATCQIDGSARIFLNGRTNAVSQLGKHRTGKLGKHRTGELGREEFEQTVKNYYDQGYRPLVLATPVNTLTDFDVQTELGPIPITLDGAALLLAKLGLVSLHIYIGERNDHPVVPTTWAQWLNERAESGLRIGRRG